MSNSPFELWPLNKQTAKILGPPLVAVTSTAQLAANTSEWVWFDRDCAMAIWRGPAWQHRFPAASLEEALQCVEQGVIG